MKQEQGLQEPCTLFILKLSVALIAMFVITCTNSFKWLTVADKLIGYVKKDKPG